jgi:hypothetical protein
MHINLYADNYLIQTCRLTYHDRHPHTNAKMDLPKWNTKTTELPNWIAELSNWICFAKLDCQTELSNWIAEPNCQTELPNCQIEFVLPNWIAEPNYQTELLNCQIEFILPNWIAKLNCLTELPNRITQPNCRIVKLNSFRQTELSNCRIELVLPNRIAKQLNCWTELSNWIADLNYETKLPN